jgi:hypothetical protein
MLRRERHHPVRAGQRGQFADELIGSPIAFCSAIVDAFSGSRMPVEEAAQDVAIFSDRYADRRAVCVQFDPCRRW